MSSPQCQGRLVVVSGLSGSGKSTVLKALEDIGYLAIDNLPVVLLPKVLALRQEGVDFGSAPEAVADNYIRLAVGMDAREPELAERFESIFRQARDMGYDLDLVFIKANEETLVKRFSETRRPHHLAPHGDILSAIRAERAQLEPLRLAADEEIDTSTLKAAALRELVMSRFNQSGGRNMSVELLSFGFKKGLPPEADLMVDVRFLPNPFYVNELRNLDGRDRPVIDYVLAAPETTGFLERFTSLLTYLLPLYRKEGKAYLTIAVGCTGGQHRSVAVAGFLASALRGSFDGQVQVRHRDIV